MVSFRHSIKAKISLYFFILNFIIFLVFIICVNQFYYQNILSNTQNTNATDLTIIDNEFGVLRYNINDITLSFYADNTLGQLTREMMDIEDADYNAKENIRNRLESAMRGYLYQYDFMRSIYYCSNGSGSQKYTASKYYFPSDRIFTMIDNDKDADINTLRLNCVHIPGNTIMFTKSVKNFPDALWSNEILGTYAVLVDAAYLRRIASTAKITLSGYMLFVDNNSDIILQYSSSDALIPTSIDFPLFELENGAIINIGGRSLLISKKYISSINLTAVIVTPVSDLKISGTAFRNSLILLTITMIIINFIIIWVLSSYLSKPIAKLNKIMNSVASGKIDARYEVNTKDEFGNIGETFNGMLEKLRTLLEENSMITIQEKDARIHALQAQINPHFIYNTLDTINWKAAEYNDHEINEIISRLGEMLRYSTEKYGSHVTLGEEINRIRNYLFIHNMRVDTPIKTIIRIQPELASLTIPCLLLQPLVENAVMHGLRNKDEGAMLVISARRRGAGFVVTVFDNGVGIAPERLLHIGEKTGRDDSVGLRNVKQRCRLLYGEQYGLRIKSRFGRCTSASILFPGM